jgi:hypothetical protein
VDGFDRYWGFMKCTARDWRRSCRTCWTRLNKDDRAYVIGAMRSVYSVQQVGSVGRRRGSCTRAPKDGWSLE